MCGGFGVVDGGFVDPAEFVIAEASLDVLDVLMARGFDSGEGLASLLFASEEPRGGMLTSLASFLAMGVA